MRCEVLAAWAADSGVDEAAAFQAVATGCAILCYAMLCGHLARPARAEPAASRPPAELELTRFGSRRRRTFALSAADAGIFRRIALLAEDAVLKGRYCEAHVAWRRMGWCSIRRAALIRHAMRCEAHDVATVPSQPPTGTRIRCTFLLWARRPPERLPSSPAPASAGTWMRDYATGGMAGVAAWLAAHGKAAA